MHVLDGKMVTTGTAWFKWKLVQNKQVKMEGVHSIIVIVVLLLLSFTDNEWMKEGMN